MISSATKGTVTPIESLSVLLENQFSSGGTAMGVLIKEKGSS